ncbi:hypothetical protein R6Q59_019867 [Mikania micrantha]
MLWALLLADEMQLRKSISVRLPSKHLKYQGILYMSKYLKQQGFLNLFSKIKETGPDGKKEAMRKAEASGTKNCLVKVKLVAPPCYVLNTQTLKKEQGIKILTEASAACATAIERQKGKLNLEKQLNLSCC